MGNISELLFIFVLALLVLGPKRLPEVGRSLGRTLAELKRATSGLKESIEREIQSAQEEAAAATSTAHRPKPSEAGNNPDAPKT